MVTIELVSIDTKEIIDSGLYGHNFIIPRLHEKITYKGITYELINIIHEFIGMGSVLQTNKITLEVVELNNEEE